jgi:hypothetical protein
MVYIDDGFSLLSRNFQSSFSTTSKAGSAKLKYKRSRSYYLNKCANEKYSLTELPYQGKLNLWEDLVLI